MIILSSFPNSPVFNTFPVHTKTKTGVSNSSCLKGVFEKFRFRDGLVWIVGVIVELKLLFQISRRSVNRALAVKMRVGLIVRALNSGSRGLGSSSGRGYFVVFLGKILYSPPR